MKSFARNCVKHGMKSSAKPSAPAARCYATEVKDYVYHINNGDIDGVDPSVIHQCPVCKQIFQEMNLTAIPTVVHPRAPLPSGLGPHVWLMLALLEQQEKVCAEQQQYEYK